jgi:hypothetical protein
MRGTSIGAPGSAAPGDATQALGSSGAAGPGVSRLLMPGSLGFPPMPIDWRRVVDDAEFMCSQVAIMEGLLHGTLASINWNILRPIRVSLKKRGKFVCAPPASFEFSHSILSSFLQLLS